MYQCGICLKGPNGETLKIKKIIAQKPQTWLNAHCPYYGYCIILIDNL